MGNGHKPHCYSYLRFSRPEQKTSDSIRRQQEASKKYADEHGLELDDSLTLRDEGISAFRSSHVERGALGVFMGLVEAGRVPKGSYLLVESLDRLSRDSIDVALTQLLTLIRGGVRVVTLMDQMEYSAESIRNQPYQLMASLVVMMTANEESKKKSDRLTKVWEQKRKDAAEGKIITARTPSWMKLDKKKQKIELIPERAKIVKRIYEMSAAGNGVYTIVATLNEEGVPPFQDTRKRKRTNIGKRTKGWSFSTVQKILKSRTTIGELVFSQGTGKKLQTIGDPIPGYYPAAISEDFYHEVQAKMAARRTHEGPRAITVGNLFTGLSKCGYCGQPMRIVGKTLKNEKGYRHKYYTCRSGKNNLGCERISLNYYAFERDFLKYTTELDVVTLLAGRQEEAELEIATNRQFSLQEQIAQVKTRLNNIINLIIDETDPDLIKDYQERSRKLKAEERDLIAELEQTEQLIVNLSQSSTQARHHLATVKELAKAMGSLEGAELVELRHRIKSAIKALVERIDCFPNGLRGKTIVRTDTGLSVEESNFDEIVAAIKQAKQMDGITYNYIKSLRDYLDHVREYTKLTTGRDCACFLVTFKSGYARLFEWSRVNMAFDNTEAVTAEGWQVGAVLF